MHLKTVGVRNLSCPVRLRRKEGGHQHTVATFAMTADLPELQRKNCVSTLLSVMENFQEDISFAGFAEILDQVVLQLSALSARLEMTFPYFINKTAPVTQTRSLMEYTCRFSAEAGDTSHSGMTIWVPVTTLCPCSKEISMAGAHNQRAQITLQVRCRGFIWLEDLIGMVESSGSSELFSLLKRPDEKHVTEEAYNNPMFVEDVVRSVAMLADAHPDISWFSVSVESFESIHKHSAYACTDKEMIHSTP